jgi:hypothetical protein
VLVICTTHLKSNIIDIDNLDRLILIVCVFLTVSDVFIKHWPDGENRYVIYVILYL